MAKGKEEVKQVLIPQTMEYADITFDEAVALIEKLTLHIQKLNSKLDDYAKENKKLASYVGLINTGCNTDIRM